MSPEDNLTSSEGSPSSDLVSWTFGNVDYDQDRKIYIDPLRPKRSFSASEARISVRKLIAGFKANGLQPGDCVCVHAFNDVMYPILFLGIIGAGGYFTGSNPAWTPSEFGHHVRTTKTRFLITEPALLRNVASTAEKSEIHVSRIFILDGSDFDMAQKSISVQDLMKHGEADWLVPQDTNSAKYTTAALLPTSGTTGIPKAAKIPHYSCIMQNIILQDPNTKTYNASRLITLPLFHAYAFPIAHISPLREGIPTYIMRRFELAKYLMVIHKYKITETPMVPAMMDIIIRDWPSVRPRYFRNPLSTLKLVWCAGSPLNGRTQEEFYRLLDPSARVLQNWGMTEAGWITTFRWPEKDLTGSVGRLLPGMEARFVSEEGHLIERSTLENPAEISVRGPTIMQGYLGNAEASSAAIDADGWLNTGDLGYEEYGKFYVVGRKKDIIKVRGWQVSPAELESTLKHHHHIVDAAVFGVVAPISTIGEMPRAYIVRDAGSELTEQEVRSHMSKFLSSYKQLNGGIVFVDSIPRNATGKIDRKVLKSESKEYRPAKPISIGTTIALVYNILSRLKVGQRSREAPIALSPPCGVPREISPTLGHNRNGSFVVKTGPGGAPGGETTVEEQSFAASMVHKPSVNYESSSPSSQSSNERTFSPSPTIASSVTSDAGEGHPDNEVLSDERKVIDLIPPVDDSHDDTSNWLCRWRTLSTASKDKVPAIRRPISELTPEPRPRSSFWTVMSKRSSA